MKTASKITLGSLLGLVNGYLLGECRPQWIETNDVGRGYMTIIIPCVMIVVSLLITVAVLAVDWIVNRINANTRNNGIAGMK